MGNHGSWPVLRTYDEAHLLRIAMPLGGIGTGTVGLGGRGDLRDWEIMNRPAKGFVPVSGRVAPFFALAVRDGSRRATRALEGPLPPEAYEGDNGSHAPNHGLPRFAACEFRTAYPLAQVSLRDPDIPVQVCLEAFNPLIPCDADASGIPVAVLRFVLSNRTSRSLEATVCGTLPNFVGMDGSQTASGWDGHRMATGACRNRNRFRRRAGLCGIFMDSRGVDPRDDAFGTLALSTTCTRGISYRTDWLASRWGNGLLDFWDDFHADGALENRRPSGSDMPLASLAVGCRLPARGTRRVTFLLTWHFPNRATWTPKRKGACCPGRKPAADRIGNYYTTRYRDAWDVAATVRRQLPGLEAGTVRFVRAFCESALPPAIKEAALFNLSTLRTQTCFRTPDGRLYGWEGCCDSQGCCLGSCTHVWNYEQTTPFLFGDLALTMREIEFAHATRTDGLMSFRVHLPLARAREHGRAAADGQMGCIMKMYRDWQLSGDTRLLERLWPRVRKTLEFCWIPGGWDADQDGVMEGCQHNTMDVEYFGPNPQMTVWYLGALRSAEIMARYLGEEAFASRCRALFDQGSAWIDQHLFNGEYYEHKIVPPRRADAVAPGLQVGMGAKDLRRPEFQLGQGCLVDQLVGQFMAHLCGLGYLVKRAHVQKTLKSVLRYNRKASFRDHFNCFRSYVLGDEAALLMAAYPKKRPQFPFPYFTEVMTGFEYTAAIGMLQEGQVRDGLRCIQDIRDRYDGRKRNPFDEAECGHHYARAMVAWAAVLALTGFRYTAVEKRLTFDRWEGTQFWSTGWAWGTCRQEERGCSRQLTLRVLGGRLPLQSIEIRGSGLHTGRQARTLRAGQTLRCLVH